jgi:hypothetical protein
MRTTGKSGKGSEEGRGNALSFTPYTHKKVGGISHEYRRGKVSYLKKRGAFSRSSECAWTFSENLHS